MLRVIFDTNIYGNLLNESDLSTLETNIIREKEFVVYGYSEIRKEMRDVSKETKEGRHVRIILLGLYDRIVGKHSLKESKTIIHLGKRYHDSYKEMGGVYGWDTSIGVDFMIVACATLNDLDIIYSNDGKTLLCDIAKNAYHKINLEANLRTPNFLEYKDLIEKFRKL